MSFFKITESFQDTANKLIALINAHLDYYQVVAFDKIILLLSKGISTAIVGFTGFMVVFFGSFALANFLGEILVHSSLGFLIVGLGYGIGGAIVWSNRVNWIINPMIQALSETVEKTSEDLGLEDNAPGEDSINNDNDMDNVN